MHRCSQRGLLSLFIAVVGPGLSACTEDKATPDYKRCIDYEAKDTLDLAQQACASAASADPASKDGVAAAAKLAEIDTKVKTDQARAVAEAAARVAADDKARQDVVAARCKGKKWATKCMTGHRPDGTEKWTGMQQFDTLAECQKVTSGVGTCDECACM
jgi:hypothetical protein